MGPEGWLVVSIAVVKNVLVLGKKLTARSFIYSPQKNIGGYELYHFYSLPEALNR